MSDKGLPSRKEFDTFFYGDFPKNEPTPIKLGDKFKDIMTGKIHKVICLYCGMEEEEGGQETRYSYDRIRHKFVRVEE